MMFLYQCVNKNIELNLFTQNKESAIDYLKKQKIDINLFNLLESGRDDIKSNIRKQSIFISNDGNLRNEIRDICCCFSNNITEALIDWRA